jgi:putative ABC transport system permease protein
MNSIALEMLVGNRTKYFAIVFGIAFSSLLITQQCAIFWGAMLRTTNQIRDIQGADIWVMDPHVEFLGDVRPLRENDLLRVRGVPGVEWTASLFIGQGRLKHSDGRFQQVVLIGLDDATLAGAPREMVLGDVTDLRRPEAIIVDQAGYESLWPGEPLRTGRVLEINDRRAVVVGICKASATFILANPVVYANYSRALAYAPPQARSLSFVLAQSRPGTSREEVCRRIERQTGLQAAPRSDFEQATMYYYLLRTGVAVNFGVTVLLGFVIGIAIAGQTFYTFTVENLKQYGTLKALGLSNHRVAGMILLQSALVSVTGYGLGVGLAALFGHVASSNSRLAYHLTWQVLVLTGAAVLVIALLSSLLSARRVFRLDPAIVFRS